MNNSSVEFYLKTPIGIAKGGEITEVSLLELSAPSSKVRTQAAKLKQLVMRSISEVNDNVSDEQREAAEPEAETEMSADESGEALLAVLGVSKSVDMEVAHEVFADLIKKDGICMVDGDVKMTSPIYDKLNFNDCERLLGFYISSFLL